MRDVGERNVTVSGAGRIEGGTYGTVRIAGAGRVVGDLVAEEFKAAGSAKVEGNLKAQRFEAAGSFKCEGDLEVEEGEAAGSLKVEGHLHAKELKLAGSARAKSIRGGYLRAGGSLGVEENVEVETFRLIGAFEIGGLLSADRVEVELEGRARAQEIGGEKILIRAGQRSLGGFLSTALGLILGHASPKELVAEIIEGDEIELEATQARLVRGGRIKIGPGCRIERVEYTDSLEVAPGAQVKEEVKG
ncbi:MAG: bactofilin [Candidatus Bipolaricaulota bacterium]|nr:bactofilin [Candidatus Bipolaricaulota bacterium]MDW8152029.1 bactofilin [Candidatus Bipolaricaulota bacterium]